MNKKIILLSSGAMLTFLMSSIKAVTRPLRTLSAQDELTLIRKASDSFAKFKSAIQSGKSKDEVRQLSRSLAQEVNTLVRGYAGGTSKIVNEQARASDTDKAVNAQQIKKLEDAWKKADVAAKEAKKANKVSPEELRRLQQEALSARNAYDTRKGQYIYNGQLKTIVRI